MVGVLYFISSVRSWSPGPGCCVLQSLSRSVNRKGLVELTEIFYVLYTERVIDEELVSDSGKKQ